MNLKLGFTSSMKHGINMMNQKQLLAYSRQQLKLAGLHLYVPNNDGDDHFFEPTNLLTIPDFERIWSGVELLPSIQLQFCYKDKQEDLGLGIYYDISCRNKQNDMITNKKTILQYFVKTKSETKTALRIICRDLLTKYKEYVKGYDENQLWKKDSKNNCLKFLTKLEAYCK